MKSFIELLQQLFRVGILRTLFSDVESFIELLRQLIRVGIFRTLFSDVALGIHDWGAVIYVEVERN